MGGIGERLRLARAGIVAQVKRTTAGKEDPLPGDAVKDVEPGLTLATSGKQYHAAFFLDEYPKDRDAHRMYDMQKLMDYEYLMLWDRTLFTGPQWALMASVTGLTLLSMTICPAPILDLGFCVGLNPNSDWFTFSTLTSFLLGLFANNMFSRWWTVRDKLQSLNTSIITAALVAAAADRLQGGVPAIRTILRYLNLMHALALKRFRKEDVDDKLLAARMPDGQLLITLEELDQLKKCSWGESYEMVAGWIYQTTAADMPLKGGGNTKYIRGMESETKDINGQIQNIVMFLEEQLPRQYVHLLCFMTRVHITFVHLYCAGLLGSACQRGITISWELILQAYAIMIVNYLLYHGILLLAEMLSNPFGNDAVDIGVHDLWEKTCSTSYALMKNTPDFLPICPEKFGKPKEKDDAEAKFQAAELKHEQEEAEEKEAGDGEPDQPI